ncbi:MAG: DUF2189 domain-containing protein [Alsobacter sp.]
MADHVLSATQSAASEALEVRRIKASDLRDCLREGLADFTALRTHALFLIVLYPVIGLLLGAVTSNDSLMPLFFPLAAGFALVGPIAAIGLYELSRRRELGHEPTLSDAAHVVRSPSIGPIFELSLLLALIFVAWLVAATLIYGQTMAGLRFSSYGAFIQAVFTTPQGWALILVGNVVGFLFAALSFTLTAVSYPLLLDRPVTLRAALATSVAAIRTNPGPMAAWALTIAVLLLVGSIPAFVGLAVVLPVLGHATWHLYRRLVP